MSQELTAERREEIRALTKAVVRDLVRGVRKCDIVRHLATQGWSDVDAEEYVTKIERAVNDHRDKPAGRQALARAYARHMLYGVLWAAGGITVTVITLAASANGGTYIVAWGAIIFGIIDFFRGLFGWLKYKD
jgi:hypothetical protein